MSKTSRPYCGYFLWNVQAELKQEAGPIQVEHGGGGYRRPKGSLLYNISSIQFVTGFIVAFGHVFYQSVDAKSTTIVWSFLTGKGCKVQNFSGPVGEDFSCKRLPQHLLICQRKTKCWLFFIILSFLLIKGSYCKSIRVPKNNYFLKLQEERDTQ